ncbi:hypothetical protein BaRGS_00015341, partial [Batillaria attramentaria]
MGCRKSKPATDHVVDKEGSRDNIGNGKDFTGVPPATKTCEKLGVTSRQIFSLRQSWKGIKRNMDQAGVEMFVRVSGVKQQARQAAVKSRVLKAIQQSVTCFHVVVHPLMGRIKNGK